MPVSATRASPYFSCRPAKPWFTSPSRPRSSPNATIWRESLQSSVESPIENLETVERRRILSEYRRNRLDRQCRTSRVAVEVRAHALRTRGPHRSTPLRQSAARLTDGCSRSDQRLLGHREQIASQRHPQASSRARMGSTSPAPSPDDRSASSSPSATRSASMGARNACQARPCASLTDAFSAASSSSSSLASASSCSSIQRRIWRRQSNSFSQVSRSATCSARGCPRWSALAAGSAR